MKTILIDGALGKKYGTEFRMDVSSAAEAVHALSLQLPGFGNQLLTDKRTGYAVFVDDVNIGEDELHMHAGERIRIVPIVYGSGGDNGIFKVIVGAVLMVAGGLTGNPQMMVQGFMMWAGGMHQLLSKKPKGKPEGDKPVSKFFNGGQNIAANGAPLPLPYGRCYAGSVVISMEVRAEDQVYIPLDANADVPRTDTDTSMGGGSTRYANDYRNNDYTAEM